MKFNHLHALSIIAVAGCLMAGCRSDIDFNNIDTKSDVSMGLVLPVGSINATLSDFLNTDSIPTLYYDADGVLTFEQKFGFAHNQQKMFHQVDLSQHISDGQYSIKIKNKVSDQLAEPAKTYFETTGTVSGPLVLNIDFPLLLNLDRINNATSTERLDSAWIENAKFMSQIGRTEMDDLKWDWIKKITMDLGSTIRRKETNVNIYDRETQYASGMTYGEKFPLNIDNFTLCLMKDLSKAPGDDNVLTSCDFQVHLTIEIPEGESVHVTDNSAFVYNLEVQFIDYQAIWGMFAPSQQMSDADLIDFSDTWKDLPVSGFDGLPVAKPLIDASIITHIAGAFVVHADSIYTVDANDQKHFATFGGATNYTRNFVAGEYLNPHTSAITDSTTNMRLVFTNHPDSGKISTLIEKTPYKLGYKFGFDINKQETPQIRITPSTTVRLDGKIRLPFEFNDTFKMVYTDTIRNIDISQFSIDSLRRESNTVVIDSIKQTSNVKLLLGVENQLPFNVKAVFRFLDENGQILKDAKGDTLNLVEGDTVMIAPPAYSKVGGEWKADVQTSNVVIALTEEQLNAFPKTKAILYSVYIDNKYLDNSKIQDGLTTKLTSTDGVKFTIGLAAKVDAILHFNTNNNSNNQK
ncbi:MAG: hypothetical protein IJ814_03735 [Paludibacteraceae bacterium]|nr:hypothetical protein [Paludibacteraceae bacterium]